MSLLIVERGPDAGTRIPLTVFPIKIGRDPSNDIVLKDEECSRFHLRLKQRGRLIIAEDLESRNGSYINGDRIINCVVKNGDKILIGTTELSFVTSTPNIQFSTEIMDFDMVVAEELGLEGPIDLAKVNERNSNFKPIRLNHHQLINKNAMQGDIKKIFEMHGNILVSNNLEEAAKTFLKHVGQILPHASRAAFFIWFEATRQLIPVASKHYRKKQGFLLSQRAFEDVITRKQAVIIQEQAPGVTQTGRNRAVLPIIQNDTPLCVVHIEADGVPEPFPLDAISLIQGLILRSAATFESFLLRKELDGWLVGIVETMIATVEAKDTYTRGHSERVSKYSIAIADELKLDRETKKLLMISALCHDIGKIGIPDSILKKASLLSAEEYNEMKLHPTIGADIVQHLPNAQRFISGVKHHHEKWDGTGYPDGLVGEEIPFFGRIIAIADVYDAMVSGRSYSGFLNQFDAAERIQEEKDLFDPEALKAFQKAHASGSLTLKTDTQNQMIPEHEFTRHNKIVINADVPAEDGRKTDKSKKKIKTSKGA